MCDREVVKKCVSTWFGSKEDFEAYVRSYVLDAVCAELQDSVITKRQSLAMTVPGLWGFMDLSATFAADGHWIIATNIFVDGLWLDCPHHPCPFPLSTTPLPRCMRYQRVVDAARLIEVPCSGCVPESFLSGRWRGDAVRLQGAKDHPTAAAERAQDLCWALSFQKESIQGVGFTTWPAAAVLCNVGGRAWHKLSGRYEGGRFELELGWEASVASRQGGEPLGADQGERRMLRCQVGSSGQKLAQQTVGVYDSFRKFVGNIFKAMATLTEQTADLGTQRFPGLLATVYAITSLFIYQ
eukprot:s1298_g15.t1